MKSIVYLNEVHYNKDRWRFTCFVFPSPPRPGEVASVEGMKQLRPATAFEWRVTEYVPLQAWNLLDLIWSYWWIYCLISSWLFATAFSVALAKANSSFLFCSKIVTHPSHHNVVWWCHLWLFHTSRLGHDFFLFKLSCLRPHVICSWVCPTGRVAEASGKA